MYWRSTGSIAKVFTNTWQDGGWRARTSTPYMRSETERIPLFSDLQEKAVFSQLCPKGRQMIGWYEGLCNQLGKQGLYVARALAAGPIPPKVED